MAILSERLRGRGHRVVPVCSPRSELFEDLRRRRFQPVPLVEEGYFRPASVGRLARWLLHHSPDVLHLHYARDLWSVVPAMALSQRVPVVLIKHIGTQRPKRDPLHCWLYHHVDTMIAISRVIHSNILETHPISAERVELLHHGVDLTVFDPCSVDGSAARAELGIGPEELVVGIVGRIQRSKGYVEFLVAARQLVSEFGPLRFLLVGEPSRGEEREASEVLGAIESLGLQDRVIVTGYRADVARMLAAMDVFVFPSHAEAFGLVLVEAMAMARPVVSSNCDGVLDIVVDGETGFLVPPKNVSALARSIGRLLRDLPLRKQFGRAGRARVETMFDMERTIDRVEAIYERVCGAPGPTVPGTRVRAS